MLDYIKCIYSSYGHFCLTYFCKQHPQGQVSLCFGHCKELMILTYFHELKNTGHLFRFQNNITPVNIMSILISCLRMLLHLSYCLLIWKDVTCNEVTSR